jgi:hypothetical protein
MTNRKSPKVSKVMGSVRKTKTGRRTALTTPRTKAATRDRAEDRVDHPQDEGRHQSRHKTVRFHDLREKIGDDQDGYHRDE